MCEDAPAVVALAFLQNEVSTVVNHDDHEESAVFRSLLTHLLAQPPAPSPPAPSRLASTSRDRLDSPSSSNSGSGEWTSELPGRRDEDGLVSDAGQLSKLSQRSWHKNAEPFRSLLGDPSLVSVQTQCLEVLGGLTVWVNL